MTNYVVVECNCERSQIAVSDEPGEDIRLFERRREIVEELEPCERCGKLPTVTISMTEAE